MTHHVQWQLHFQGRPPAKWKRSSYWKDSVKCKRVFSPSSHRKKKKKTEALTEVQEEAMVLNKCIISESKALSTNVLQSRDIHSDNPDVTFCVILVLLTDSNLTCSEPALWCKLDAESSADKAQSSCEISQAIIATWNLARRQGIHLFKDA